MGYVLWQFYGYGMHFPAHQVGGQAELWDITGYGFSQVWVMRGPTVHQPRWNVVKRTAAL